ncbi:MAG TPA: hypothetical protein PLR54_08970 [Spirochaetota bacterium]|nr:hypothetical protein [Spirochaetota bacterium]HOM87628.1 hypothetical protein [Spirochaetota bacterium]HOR92648.1 hypothetical protein [Spirochaetota bacterium]HOT18993.1 hypothetical protein [Spirochaetota bacterium]HPD04115.1 hypothetical protein [Spirochaetota bacterium]
MNSTVKDFDIFNYLPKEEDSVINNPYLQEILTYRNNQFDEYQYWNVRYDLIKKYAFAVPTIDTIKIIQELSPIIEIGAGNGYWAYILNQVKVDIIATDKYPPDETALPFSNYSSNQWFHNQWYDVIKAEAIEAGNHPERALMLCWPEPQSMMAYESLYAYKNAGGHTIIFIGDMIACAESNFYDALAQCKLEVKQQIWGYKYFNEIIAIYKIY